MSNPYRPAAFVTEKEPFRNLSGQVSVVDVSTVFLTAKACPIGCTMCDLHIGMLSEATPEGSIPEQIDYALDRLPAANWIKLYNAGNFFDPASIPQQDYAAIAARCDGFDRVIVENHPRFGITRHKRWLDVVPCQLEVAVGLETVQPRWLNRLNKQMSRDDFDRYARQLVDRGIDLRVFLIVGAPGIDIKESYRWSRLSVRHAVAAGARHISLIPARPGNGWNGIGKRLPVLSIESLLELLQLCMRDVNGAACLSVDLWGFDRTSMPPDQQKILSLIKALVEYQCEPHRGEV